MKILNTQKISAGKFEHEILESFTSQIAEICETLNETEFDICGIRLNYSPTYSLVTNGSVRYELFVSNGIESLECSDAQTEDDAMNGLSETLFTLSCCVD